MWLDRRTILLASLLAGVAASLVSDIAEASTNDAVVGGGCSMGGELPLTWSLVMLGIVAANIVRRRR